LSSSPCAQGGPPLDRTLASAITEFAGRLASYLVSIRDFNAPHWSEALTPYLEVVCTSLEVAEEVAANLCEACKHLGRS
jgi:hypothetical protein